MSAVNHEFTYGGKTYHLQSGVIARQAHGAVLLSVGKIRMLATVVVGKKAEQDFFPLTVHYQEKHYAAGRIPGSFNKREGRPSDRETLIARLIDRSVRPLFPEGFKDEIQVVVTALSADLDEEIEVAAMLAASAALSISGVPFQGPIGAAIVGYTPEGTYLLNPSRKDLKNSLLEMIVAGTKEAVNMVESEARELSEEVMLGAVIFAHEEMQKAIIAIEAFAKEVNRAPLSFELKTPNPQWVALVEEKGRQGLEDAYRIKEKADRRAALSAVRDSVREAAESLATEEEPVSPHEITQLIHDLEYRLVREKILSGEPRIDGRTLTQVRPITIDVGLLPSAHGSALFTRGETQVLGVVTLGEIKSSQLLDSMYGEAFDRVMFQYNFPPFCVGETGPIGSPKRREIGHGNLARRGVMPSLPNEKEFPYSLRIVAETLESNGSSSMASVCAASLAAMDAGVPVSMPVAGVAMGLIKEGDRYQVLTDILGDEDHLGDMDFKVAGSHKGITALQMDIKISGITHEIMQLALKQAKDGRLHILECMKSAISEPRRELSGNAPRIAKKKIDPAKIREVIGKGGETIQRISKESGVQIDIQDDGTILIYATSKEGSDKASEMIDGIIQDLEIGKTYRAKIVRLAEFGAFAAIVGSRKEGLIHVSQISSEFVKNVEEFLQVGQEVTVKVQDIDRQGRVRLSYKDVAQESA